MGRATPEQLRQEVEELTSLLREDDDLASVRRLLAANGKNERDVLLVGLIGGEDESLYGVIVEASGDFTRFDIAGDGSLRLWELTRDVASLLRDFEAVEVAREMIT